MDALFLNPLGLLALAALPAIVALHLFRRRFRPRTVSALFLWAPDDRTVLAGRKRDPLRNTASLWLELAAALALALALAGPRACAGGRAQHLVVVLDGSASMSALGANLARSLSPRSDASAAAGPAQRARELLRQRIDALSADSRVSLIVSGARPRLLAGPAALPAEARERLSGYEPRSRSHDLGPALALARELASGTAGTAGAVLLLTDHYAPEALPPEIELQALGEPRANLGLVRAERLRGADPAGAEIAVLTVRSASGPAGAASTRAALRVHAGGALVAERALELAPGEERQFSFALPARAPALEARIEAGPGEDGLAIDDQAYLAPLSERTLLLWAALSPEHASVLGFGARDEPAQPPELGSLLALVPDSARAASAAEAHLLVSTGSAGGPASHELAIHAPPEGGATSAWLAPFLTEKSHPLFDGIGWQGVIWSGQASRELPGAPLVSAGSTALIREEREGARRTFHLNLDPTRSTLSRSPDWPVLLSNLAELRRAELPGSARTNFRTEERFTWRGEAGLHALVGPGPRVEQRSRGLLELDLPEVPGLYALEREGRELCRLGLSFADTEESELGLRSSGHRPAAAATAAAAGERSPLETLLLVLGLAAALTDWWLLAGRRAAQA